MNLSSSVAVFLRLSPKKSKNSKEGPNPADVAARLVRLNRQVEQSAAHH
ncbi:hypothetical protein KFU94_26825 [Chloroflexi bacterium TSY]|nr:hypothetical protein [Chloroflexi bacterium TSY]